MKLFLINTRYTLLLAGCLFSNVAFPHAPAQGASAATENRPVGKQFVLPAAIAVSAELPPPAPGVTDIKFREFFKLPIGPRGLEPSEKLLGLDGKTVRIIGYMVDSESAQKGMFILSPLPVSIGDEDESLSDDLPASVVFVHVNNDHTLPFVPGLIKLTGVLQVGSLEETDGRVSSVRLQADSATTKALLKVRQLQTQQTQPKNQHQARN